MCSRCCISASVCWPRDQLTPSSSWCNWWKCAQSQISAAARVSGLVSPICSYLTPPALGLLPVNTEVLFDAPYACTTNSISVIQYLSLWVCVCACACVFSRIETGCVLAVLHMDGKKCSGFAALHAGCLTSRTKRRQHSSCYRYANVRVVMIAAQPEISSCYLRSAENVRSPPQNTLTHPNLNDLCSHSSDT